MARKPFIGGNWKMNLTREESNALARAVASQAPAGVDTAIFPAFPYLAGVGDTLRSANPNQVKLGAQDFYFQPNGAFTGEVSVAMLKDLGVQVVLAGHSERRHVLGESDELINRKVRAALDAGLEVILCVGEKLEQREAGQTHDVNRGQVLMGLAGVKREQLSRVTIAYEPVWAIGTGKNATPADAQEAHDRIRRCVEFSLLAGDGHNRAEAAAIAAGMRIQYGGSVKPANAKELFSQSDIDGGLIGGASLKSEDFLAIVKAAAK